MTIFRSRLLPALCCCVALLAACSDQGSEPAAPSATERVVLGTTGEEEACADGSLAASTTILTQGFTLNHASTRHQPAFFSHITRENIGRLKLVWSYVFDGEEERRGHPSVTSDAVILGSVAGTVRALGRTTGCEIWSFDAREQVRTAAILHQPDTRQLQVFFGDTGTFVYALDARSGSLLWETQVDTHSDAILTGSPQLVQDMLLVPVSSLEVRTAANPAHPCCTFGGSLVALSIEDGTEGWRYSTMPGPAVLNLVTGKMGPSGAPIWSVPTIDEERGLVFIGTGENYSRPDTRTSDAIIALDLASGVERWHFQGTVNDVWNIACLLPAPLNANCPDDPGPDLDFGAAPVLINRTGEEDLLIAAQKSGDVYALRPADGTLVWHRTLGSGGNLGGIHWGVAADEERLYVPVADIQSRNLSFADLADLDNAATIEQPDGAAPGLYALNLESGVTEWFTGPERITPLGEQRPAILSAAVTVSNELVYAAGLDGVVRVYDSLDGQFIWEVDTTGQVTGSNGLIGHGGTIDSGGVVIAGDTIYVNSGYTLFGRESTWFGGPGNVLLAYRLQP